MSKSNSTAPLDSAKTNRDVQPHTTTAAKPAKPYPDFPVTPHPAGYWCKKTGADRAATRGRACPLRPNSLRCVGQNAQRSDRETSCSSPHSIRRSQQSNKSFGPESPESPRTSVGHLHPVSNIKPPWCA